MTDTQPAQPSSIRRFSVGADIHSHPLPTIDDGAVDMAASLMMLRVAARYGTSLMVATPHRFFGSKENTPEALRRLTEEVNGVLQALPLSRRIQLLPGQEIPLTLETGNELTEGKVLTLGDTGVYALVEPPFDYLPEWAAAALGKIVQAGVHPVLAHPERNAVIQNEPQRVVPLVEAGALLQLTAMSVTGHNGPLAEDAALWMLDRQLATVIASDTHSPTWRPPNLRRAYHVVRLRYGQPEAQRLCSDNPRAIATGQSLPTALL